MRKVSLIPDALREILKAVENEMEDLRSRYLTLQNPVFFQREITDLERHLNRYTDELSLLNEQIQKYSDEDEHRVALGIRRNDIERCIREIVEKLDTAHEKKTEVEILTARLDSLESQNFTLLYLSKLEKELEESEFYDHLSAFMIASTELPEQITSVLSPVVQMLLTTFKKMVAEARPAFLDLSILRAQTLHTQYCHLKNSGFDDDQAMQVLLAGIKPTSPVEQVAQLVAFVPTALALLQKQL